MSEQELKLHVPHTSRSSVERAVRRHAVKHIQLRAQYFDTPERALIKAGIALRLRQEGQQWVQTIKMPGAHALDREELNHPTAGPALDLSIYADLPIYATLVKSQEALSVRYETNIHRTYRNLEASQGIVEVSYDVGEIMASELRLPVCEIEFELVQGQLQSVFCLGLEWQNTHGLLLDLRSKAERGDRLAALANELRTMPAPKGGVPSPEHTRAVASFWGPRAKQAVALNASMSGGIALRVITQECLEQIARNSAVLAEVDTADICRTATPQHAHQLRIGLRRLRSAWSLFEPLTDLPPRTWRNEANHALRLLGDLHDEEVLHDTVLPALYSAGQPPLEDLEPLERDGASDIASAKRFQAWQIELLAWAVNAHPTETSRLEPTSDTKSKTQSLKRALRHRLQKWHRRILQNGLSVPALDSESQHELRKQTKRLRDGLQLVESLGLARKQRHYDKQLSRIQNTLGQMHDLHLAQETFDHIRQTQAEAWFASGWIAARLATLSNQTKKHFKKLKTTKYF